MQDNTLQLDKIQELISKHQYRVFVNATNQNNFSLNPPVVVDKRFKEDNRFIKYEIKNNTLKIDDEEITLPVYAVRPFIFSDIVQRCLKLGFNPLLIQFQIHSMDVLETTFFEYLDIALNDEEKNDEDGLRELMIQYFVDDNTEEKTFVKISRKIGVEKGFKTIVEHLSR